MYCKLAPLIIVCDGLNHRAKDIWIDLRPIQLSNFQDISFRNFAEFWTFSASSKQTAIHIRKVVRPTGYFGFIAFGDWSIHRTKDLTDDIMSI